MYLSHNFLLTYIAFTNIHPQFVLIKEWFNGLNQKEYTLIDGNIYISTRKKNKSDADWWSYHNGCYGSSNGIHNKHFPKGIMVWQHVLPLTTQLHSTEEQWHNEKYIVRILLVCALSIIRQTDPQVGFGVRGREGGVSMGQNIGTATHVVCSHTSWSA